MNKLSTKVRDGTFKGWLPNFRCTLCVIFAAIVGFFWVHSSFPEEGLEYGYANVNALVFRRLGVAVASWRGHLVIGYMNDPRYDYWNRGDKKFFGGAVEYQA